MTKPTIPQQLRTLEDEIDQLAAHIRERSELIDEITAKMALLTDEQREIVYAFADKIIAERGDDR